jgi:hypothetical protein
MLVYVRRDIDINAFHIMDEILHEAHIYNEIRGIKYYGKDRKVYSFDLPNDPLCRSKLLNKILVTCLKYKFIFRIENSDII